MDIKKVILSLVLLVFVVDNSSAIICNPNLPNGCPDEVITSLGGGGGGNSTGINQTQADALYWRLDSSNDNDPQANWNRQNKAFTNVSAIFLDFIRARTTANYTTVSDDMIFGAGLFIDEPHRLRFGAIETYPSYQASIYQSGNNLLFENATNINFSGVVNANGNLFTSDLNVVGDSNMQITTIHDTFTADSDANINGRLLSDNIMDFDGSLEIYSSDGIYNFTGTGAVPFNFQQLVFGADTILYAPNTKTFASSANLQSAGNITADAFFIGNGTRLSGVCLSNGTNCVASSGSANFTNVAFLNNTQTFTSNNSFNGGGININGSNAGNSQISIGGSFATTTSDVSGINNKIYVENGGSLYKMGTSGGYVLFMANSSNQAIGSVGLVNGRMDLTSWKRGDAMVFGAYNSAGTYVEQLRIGAMTSGSFQTQFLKQFKADEGMMIGNADNNQNLTFGNNVYDIRTDGGNLTLTKRTATSGSFIFNNANLYLAQNATIRGKSAFSTNYGVNPLYQLYIQNRITNSAETGSPSALSSNLEILTGSSITSTGNFHGYQGGVTPFALSGNVTTASYFGLRGDANGYLYNNNTMSNLVGLFGSAQSVNGGGGGGTLTNPQAFGSYVNCGSGTNCTDVYHFKIGTTGSASGNIKNAYGIFIPAMTAGVNNYELLMDTSAKINFRSNNQTIHSPSANVLMLKAPVVNVTNLLQLAPSTLPTCSSTYVNTFGANTTGTYGCNSSTWVRIF